VSAELAGTLLLVAIIAFVCHQSNKPQSGSKFFQK
jgi:hypothetical protein